MKESVIESDHCASLREHACSLYEVGLLPEIKHALSAYAVTRLRLMRTFDHLSLPDEDRRDTLLTEPTCNSIDRTCGKFPLFSGRLSSHDDIGLRQPKPAYVCLVSFDSWEVFVPRWN